MIRIQGSFTNLQSPLQGPERLKGHANHNSLSYSFVSKIPENKPQRFSEQEDCSFSFRRTSTKRLRSRRNLPKASYTSAMRGRVTAPSNWPTTVRGRKKKICHEQGSDDHQWHWNSRNSTFLHNQPTDGRHRKTKFEPTLSSLRKVEVALTWFHLF